MTESGDLWDYDENALLDRTMQLASHLSARGRRRRRVRALAELGIAVFVVIALVVVLASSGGRQIGKGRHHSTGTSSTSVPAPSGSCPQSSTSSDDVVEVGTGARFARVRVICAGYAIPASGVVAGEYLYFLQQVSSGTHSSWRAVKTALNGRSTIKSPMLHGQPVSVEGLGAPVVALGALWIVWQPSNADSTNFHMAEMSLADLRLEHTYAIATEYTAPAAGRIWYADADSLVSIDPRNGDLHRTSLSGMPAGTAVAGLAGSGSTLYVYVTGPKLPAGELLKFLPGKGIGDEVGADWYVQSLEGVSGNVLWVYLSGGNDHGVRSYSTATLTPTPGGYGEDAPNGTWVSELTPVAYWWERSGDPVACASRSTGKLLAQLAIPTKSTGGRVWVPSDFVAAGDSYLVIGARLANAGSLGLAWWGLGVYKLDPKCIS